MCTSSLPDSEHCLGTHIEKALFLEKDHENPGKLLKICENQHQIIK